MTKSQASIRFLVTAILAATASLAQAEDVGQHPAVFAPRQLPSVNPSTFIVAHPAALSWRAGHANFEHPAVQVKGEAPHVDTNGYLVQPPAPVSWIATIPTETATH